MMSAKKMARGEFWRAIFKNLLTIISYIIL